MGRTTGRGRRGTWYGLYQHSEHDVERLEEAQRLSDAVLRAVDQGQGQGTFNGDTDAVRTSADLDEPFLLEHELRPGSPGRFWEEGDPMMETPQRKRQRAALLHDELVDRGLSAYWRTFPAASKPKGLLSRADFLDLQVKLTKALYAPSEFAEPAALALAKKEWRALFGPGVEAIDEEGFKRSLFELVDHWTEDIHAASYSIFLSKLYLRVTVVPESVPGVEPPRVFAPLSTISASAAPRRSSVVAAAPAPAPAASRSPSPDKPRKRRPSQQGSGGDQHRRRRSSVEQLAQPRALAPMAAAANCDSLLSPGLEAVALPQQSFDFSPEPERKKSKSKSKQPSRRGSGGVSGGVVRRLVPLGSSAPSALPASVDPLLSAPPATRNTDAELTALASMQQRARESPLGVRQLNASPSPAAAAPGRGGAESVPPPRTKATIVLPRMGATL